MYEFFLNVLGFIELAAIIWLVAWFRRRGRERSWHERPRCS